MSDLISREDAINAVCNRICEQDFCGCDVDDCPDYRAMVGLPSAERKGHWIQISPAKIYECSVCGQNVMTDDIDCYKYCHGCGARMVSEDENI